MNGTLAPKNLEGILRDTFTIYKNNFLRLIAIMSIVSVPFAVIFIILSSRLMPMYGESATEAPLPVMLLILIPICIAYFAASVLMMGAAIHAVAEQYFNQPVNIGRAYSFAWRRMGDMFGAVVLNLLAIFGILLAVILIYAFIPPTIVENHTLLIGFVIVGILFLIAIPPILYLSIIWNFGCPTALLEGCGPRTALSRSSALVKGSWWRVLGIILLLILIGQTIVMILYIPAMIVTVISVMTGIMSGAMTEVPPEIPTQAMIVPYMISGFIGSIISMPIYVIGETLLYLDLRVRKQGYSLDALANELGIRNTSNDTAA